MINAEISDYDRFLHSDEWQKQRRKIISRDNNACRICRSKERLCVHHIGYSDELMLDDKNLVTLCEKCHSVISRKVVELNSYTFREKLEKGFFESFCANTIKDLYVQSYCKCGDKNMNFLELNKLRDTMHIVRYTLLLQKEVQDRELDCIEYSRLSSANFQIRSQDLITKYRKKYIKDELQSGVPPYAIKRYLGISNNNYNKLVRGDAGG